MNIGGSMSRVFTFDIDMVHENKSKCIADIILTVHLALAFLKWKYIFILHIIAEEPGQHIWSHLAFASQNLKFAGKMSDGRH